MPLLEWLDAHSGAVQALAAVGTLTLTLVLAFATVGYAKSARDQVAELVVGRLSSSQPLLVVVGAIIGSGDERSLLNMVVKLRFRNVGNGPAFSIRAHVRHPWVAFIPPATGVVPILANDPAGEPEELMAGRAERDHPHEPGVGVPLMLRARLEYRDVAGRWLATTVPLKLQYMFVDERSGLGEKLEVQDQEQRVEIVKQPLIRPDARWRDEEPEW